MEHAARSKVVILCGGKGTRLREETELRPKPLVAVGGRPILWHIMMHYAHYGFRDFVLCLGYRGEMIKEYVMRLPYEHGDFTIAVGRPDSIEHHGPRPEASWRITCAETGLESLTGARIKRVERYCDGADLILLTYGDGVCDLDLSRLCAFHRQHGGAGTVTGVRPQSRFGELHADGGRVQRFSEKPLASEGLVNGGFFVFDRRLFDYVEDDDACTFEGAPLERMAQDGQLHVFRHEGFWQCMDTWRDLSLLDELYRSGRAPWRSW
jgi:glucose-1-phosphate cytidylyltransferase